MEPEEKFIIMLPDEPKIGNKYVVPTTEETFVVLKTVYNKDYPSTIEYFEVYFPRTKVLVTVVWHVFISYLIKNDVILQKKCPIIRL